MYMIDFPGMFEERNQRWLSRRWAQRPVLIQSQDLPGQLGPHAVQAIIPHVAALEEGHRSLAGDVEWITTARQTIETIRAELVSLSKLADADEPLVRLDRRLASLEGQAPTLLPRIGECLEQTRQEVMSGWHRLDGVTEVVPLDPARCGLAHPGRVELAADLSRFKRELREAKEQWETLNLGPQSG